MKLLGWWKKGNASPSGVPQLSGPAQGPAFPEYARHGHIFRTRAFNKPEAGDNLITWYQAVEHPVSGKWLVQEVWSQPNTVSSSDPERVNHRKTLNNGKAVSFEEALEMLGGFEFSRKKMGFFPCTEPSLEALGDTHVERFALLNGIAFDVHGHPHMTSHGYVVTDGYFAPEMEKAVLDIHKGEKGQLPWGKAGPLSRFFEAAVLADMPDTLFDLKESYVLWQKFTDKMHETVGWLILLQNKGFTGSVHILKNIPIMYPANPHKDVPIEEYYKAARSEAEDMVVSLTHVSEFDKRNVYQKFLLSLDLVYEVAYAKYLLVNMENSKHAALSREAQKQAARLCQAQGGSSQDVAGLMAEIIGCQARQVKGWNEDTPHRFWRIMEPSIYTKKVAWYKGMSSCDLSQEVYYCPDVVIDFLETLKKTGAEFKQQVDAEQTRIIQPAPDKLALNAPEEGP